MIGASDDGGKARLLDTLENNTTITIKIHLGYLTVLLSACLDFSRDLLHYYAIYGYYGGSVCVLGTPSHNLFLYKPVAVQIYYMQL